MCSHFGQIITECFFGESYEFKEGELVDEGEPGKKPEKKPKVLKKQKKSLSLV